jgi:sortase A
MRRAVRETGLALITAGIVILLFVAYQLWGTAIAERRSQSRLRNQFNAALSARATAPAAGAGAASTTTLPPATAPSGGAVAHLQIPKIGVDKFVVAGVSVGQLRKGPGHYPQTPLPGQPGNAAIAGHRTTYGAPFYRLNELQPGDDIYVTTTAGRFLYVVDRGEVVKPTDVAVLDPTPDNRLTLTTCNPRFSAATRLVVVSHLAQPPAPAPAAAAAPSAPAASAASAADNLGAGDARAWPPTILFGALTLLLWIGVRVLGARARPRWPVFAVGIPLCLVPLWFLFENVVRLLPANI